MAQQHKDIVDSERHETKGASTATAGQVHVSLGSGVTGWASPSSLPNIGIASTIEAAQTTSQVPVSEDTALQLTFGAGDSNSDVSIAAGGAITILTAGLYYISLKMNFGRTSSTGTSIMFVRILINGTAVGSPQCVEIDSSQSQVPFNTSILRSFTANDVITVEIIRDSDGATDGGLVTTTPTAAGWTPTPSSAIRVQRILGGV